MKQKLKNNICRCAHSKKEHVKGGQDNQFVCNYYADEDPEDGSSRRCECYWYKQDNLKYLEKLYESRPT